MYIINGIHCVPSLGKDDIGMLVNAGIGGGAGATGATLGLVAVTVCTLAFKCSSLSTSSMPSLNDQACRVR